MKNESRIEKLLETKRIWTVSIGDDKMLLPDGDWGSQQSLNNFYKGAIADDLYTYEEASRMAAELNEDEMMLTSLNKYTAIPSGLKARVNLSEI